MIDSRKAKPLVIGVAIFAAAMFSGTTLVSVLSGNRVPHQCPRWGGIDPSRRFFTLNEGLQLRGQPVKYAKPARFENNSGRIAGIDLVVSGKFFIIVDWDVAPETGEPDLRWYDKDYYEEYLVPR